MSVNVAAETSWRKKANFILSQYLILNFFYGLSWHDASLMWIAHQGRHGTAATWSVLPPCEWISRESFFNIVQTHICDTYVPYNTWASSSSSWTDLAAEVNNSPPGREIQLPASAVMCRVGGLFLETPGGPSGKIIKSVVWGGVPWNKSRAVLGSSIGTTGEKVCYVQWYSFEFTHNFTMSQISQYTSRHLGLQHGKCTPSKTVHIHQTWHARELTLSFNLQLIEDELLDQRPNGSCPWFSTE